MIEKFRKLLHVTDEKREKWKQKRIEEKKKLTLESQLGFYVGEQIVDDYLPTLSTGVRSRQVIEVSEEDVTENNRLQEEWYETTSYGRKHDSDGNTGNKEKWELYFQHNKMLEKKYLPEILKCYVGILNVENIDEFKKGIINSLWNSDICCYSLKSENIKIYDDDESYTTIIEFIRSVDEL